MNALRSLWAWWKVKAHAFGVFQTKLILSLFYYALFTPVGLVATRSRRAPRPTESAWIPRATRDRSLADLRRQHS